MRRRFGLIAALFVSFFGIYYIAGCAVGNKGLTDEEFREKYNLASPEAPKPSETPKKPKEVWICRQSAQEGREFVSDKHESREESRRQAEEECQRYSRHCLQLRCEKILIKPKEDGQK